MMVMDMSDRPETSPTTHRRATVSLHLPGRFHHHWAHQELSDNLPMSYTCTGSSQKFSDGLQRCHSSITSGDSAVSWAWCLMRCFCMGNFPDKGPNWKVMLHYWGLVISHFPIFTTQSMRRLDLAEFLNWLGQH